MRRDALLDACDALACKQGRVLMLARLCLEPECRRGHGGVYDAMNSGEVYVARLRRTLAALPLPAWEDGRIRLTSSPRCCPTVLTTRAATQIGRLEVG